MSGSIAEPDEKMRSRDVNKVAKGEQAPLPPQRSPQVSRASPPSSTTPMVETETNGSLQAKNASNQMRGCYDTYYEYHKCVQENGREAQQCKKVAEFYKSMCPEWVERWRLG